ncbi:hypothetical protein [Azospirillum sp.]|uniref:hypothetical protein n=1 Tax=Azospirillum sp. TaxID=34012 RepID=UPI003D73AE5E
MTHANLGTAQHLHCLRLYVAAQLALRGGPWTVADVRGDIERYAPLLAATFAPKFGPLIMPLGPEVVDTTAAEAIAEAQQYRDAGTPTLIPFEEAANTYARMVRGLSEPATVAAMRIYSIRLAEKLTKQGVPADTARTWVAAILFRGHILGQAMDARGSYQIGHA